MEYLGRRRVYATLKNTHLPVLDEHGLIEYDDTENIVCPSSTLAELDVYVEVLRDREIPWSYCFCNRSPLLQQALSTRRWLKAT